MGGVLGGVVAATVLRHDDDGLLLGVSAGTQGWRAALHPRDVDDPAAPRAPLRPVLSPVTIRVWFPAGAQHCVRWVRGVPGWYVNLEHPVHHRGGVDSHDHELDLLVAPDRTCTWKDEERFAERTGDPRFWTVAQAAAIRVEGERVVEQVHGQLYPFGG